MRSYKYMDKRKEVFLLVTRELILESASAIHDAMQNGLIDELDRFYDQFGDEGAYGEEVLIWDRYKVHFLGDGYTGYVLKIDDMKLGVPFAIKVGLLRSETGSRYYVDDGVIAKGLLSFPEIVKVYAYDDRFCLMEYIDGLPGTFFDESALERLNFFTDMDKLIREVYDAGYGMYDLHLNNVMYTHEFELRIIDIGNYYNLSENDVTLEFILDEFESASLAMFF